MNLLLSSVFALALTFFGPATTIHIKTTDERITSQGYPVEIHTAQTSDDYILTLFRIPYSPRRENKNQKLPVVFLQHGLAMSSDCWILNGPDNAIAFQLANAGYDVWLGNFRGNSYSQKNVNISSSMSKFWNFSWNEMGNIDLPTMIDFVLSITQQSGLHYIGHSQGTTSFFVLTSENPQYNAKIRTSYMLAPVAFMNHMKSPYVKVLAPILGNQKLFSDWLECQELAANNKLVSYFESILCSGNLPFQPLCSALIFTLGGFDLKHLNKTLLPDIYETNPASSSSCQVAHYLQEYESGHFRKFDFGKEQNMKVYGKESPPDYPLGNITAPIMLLYGDNDYFSSTIDVHRLKSLLHKDVQMYELPIKQWNHFDFLWALPVKKLINDVIIKHMNEFEEQEQ